AQYRYPRFATLTAARRLQTAGYDAGVPSADRGSRREAPVNLRRLGRTRILQALFDAGELARPELIQRTGLSPATVTSVIDDLIGEDLVCRAAAASPEARLGRPPLTF